MVDSGSRRAVSVEQPPISPGALAQAAREYAARGWLVVPLHTMVEDGCSCGRAQCSSPGKHPRTRRGSKDGSSDPAQIEQWWARWPQANVGIVTGADSGLVVLDVDADHDGLESLATLEGEHGTLPVTVTSSTGGGGVHYLFADPGVALRNSAGKLGRGVDVRGKGGYIVAPPSLHRSGGRYSWQPGRAPDQVELAELPGWLLYLLRRGERRRAGARSPRGNRRGRGIEGAIVEGERNQRLASIAGSMRRQGKEEAEIYLALREINQTRVEPHLPESELAAIAASIAGYPKGVPLLEFRRTDYGNAERLAQRHGDDLIFVAGLGWYVWDGKRWQRDSSGEPMRRMKETIRATWGEAADIEDPDEKKRVAGFLVRSEQAARLKAALELAESEAQLVASVEQLDADPLLLTVANGTIDLRTGELRPHQREDLITKLAPVDYKPGARSELWQAFLARVTGGDPELEVFLQRAVGYSLTGLTREEVLFFAHGPAASGKSSFLEAIRAIAGDYSASSDFESFLKKPGSSGVRNDIARLASVRIVTGVEVDEGRELAEGLVKQLTGGDVITARYLYKEYFEFTPRFTIWLAANDRPQVSATDTGIWRRIVQIPFTQAIPEGERDPELKQRLQHDPEVQQAILAWAVQGALAWQAEGLRVPERVRSYTEEYRQEVDPLTEFIAEHCELEPAAKTDRSRLYQAYSQWAIRYAGGRPLTRKGFATALKRHGISDGGKSGNRRYWQGIRLLDNNDNDEAPF